MLEGIFEIISKVLKNLIKNFYKGSSEAEEIQGVIQK